MHDANHFEIRTCDYTTPNSGWFFGLENREEIQKVFYNNDLRLPILAEFRASLDWTPGGGRRKWLLPINLRQPLGGPHF